MAEEKKAHSFDLVIFGGGGDLSLTRIIPSLFHLYQEEKISLENCRIIAAGMTKKDGKDSFSALDTSNCFDKINNKIKAAQKSKYKSSKWLHFKGIITFLTINLWNKEEYNFIHETLSQKPNRTRIFYLAIPPEILESTCEIIASERLGNENTKVIIEKPIGEDYATAKSINQWLSILFGEKNVFRIDHYLGKDAVQNLLTLRFANRLLEPLWGRDQVDHVQITISEEDGVGGRGALYDNVGALRDMVQNHMLQLLCLIAMNPPVSLEPDAIHNEKVAVLRALRPIESFKDLKAFTFPGQYEGYDVEESVSSNSKTETFVALQVHIDNWRWFGVPFFLRTGKSMKKRYAEIVIQFRAVPHQLFEGQAKFDNNKLVISLQPDIGVTLMMMNRVPGLESRLSVEPAPLALDLVPKFEPPDAYARLLLDAINDNQTLFVRSDEVELAWRWIDRIIDGWEAFKIEPEIYDAGTNGPQSAEVCIARVEPRPTSGRSWNEHEVQQGTLESPEPS